jgi:hypothetical protein
VPQYEIYLPLNYNDGRPIEPGKLHQIKEELTYRFGGLTVFPPGTPAEGLWVHKGQLVRDDIVILRVVTTYEADDYLKKYEVTLEQRLEQEEVLIVKMPAYRL